MKDYGAEAHRAAVARLEAFYEADDDCRCFCEDCLVREVLTAAWPILQEAAKAE